MVKKVVGLMAFLLIFGSATANAAMTNFLTYTDEGAGISIDAVGVQNSPTVGNVQASIPVGASIYRAYLYSASVWSSALANVKFEGSTLTSNASSRLDVGVKQGNGASENRWDVTSAVTSKVGGGSGLFDFSVEEMGYLDGEILAVVYKVTGDDVKTAFIFDGELATTGDSFNVALGTPFTTGDDVIMSLGISFGYQGYDQFTTVDVNGTRLTSSAGGEDDGIIDQNGGLITAGGIGDSTANPANPLAGPAGNPRYDDELYNLGALLSNGDSIITINTLNPSNDDNVFFMGLTVKGEAEVTPVPEPGTLLLLGAGIIGLIGFKKERFSRS